MDDNAFGEQIRKLRNAKKITLAVMAERLGVTTSAVAAYEGGSRKPSFEMLVKIARLFNVTIDNLLGYSNKDLMDVSGLTTNQRETVQNTVAMYQMFNKLAVLIINREELTPIDMNLMSINLYEKFGKEMDEVRTIN